MVSGEALNRKKKETIVEMTATHKINITMIARTIFLKSLPRILLRYEWIFLNALLGDVLPENQAHAESSRCKGGTRTSAKES